MGFVDYVQAIIDGLLFGAVLAALIAFLRDPASPGHGLLLW